MRRLEGKVAVVTGGNSGIGLASAKRLLDEGARVAIAGRSQKTLDEAVKYLGNGTLAVQTDVAKLADLDKLYAAVSKKLGKIDILFVNAGVANFAPFADTTEQVYDTNFDINAKGAFFTIQKAIPFLNDGASIILNTSVAGQKGFGTAGSYAATKAALRSFARTAASELVGRNIRVNTVAPGPIETPIFGRIRFPGADEAVGTARRSCGGCGVPGIVGLFVYYWRGDQCGWRSGPDLNAFWQSLRVDGAAC
jgi:NAD(P)-dependent dehydrogenase (short-subunit alcohol dehydrogenase family)